MIYLITAYMDKNAQIQTSSNKRINNQIVVHPFNGTMDGIQDSLKLVSMESFRDVEMCQNLLTLKRHKIAKPNK